MTLLIEKCNFWLGLILNDQWCKWTLGINIEHDTNIETEHNPLHRQSNI